MQVVNFTIVRGDDFNQVVQFMDADDLPIDISSWTDLTAKLVDIDRLLEQDITITIVTAETGLVRLTLAAAITARLLGAYLWDFQRTLSSNVKTMMGGAFVVSADVTTLV
jgi:hypothetical protein